MAASIRSLLHEPGCSFSGQKIPVRSFPAFKTLIGEGRQFIVLYTLNDYDQEGLEPGIPSLSERIRTFTELS